jgi:hypothetical protein
MFISSIAISSACSAAGGSVAGCVAGADSPAQALKAKSNTTSKTNDFFITLPPEFMDMK